MAIKGFLGIDAGTQGLSVVFTDEELKVLGTGEASYEMVSNLDEGCYEQLPSDWDVALANAMRDLRNQMNGDFDVLAIGISGQMHGEVLADENGASLAPARLWCDARNEAEEIELTEAMGVKMPKRITAARWLWTLRNRPELARQTRHLTTPAGWLAFQLTGEWLLGIGDAAGMFPIDQATLNYDQGLLEKYDIVAGQTTPLRTLLPEVRQAGQSGGVLSPQGAAQLGLPKGIPVAPAEGDQPAALAGSLIGEAGMISCSFGTSVCANSVGDRSFLGVSKAVDHFCAPDGKPINMVWLRNGTTFMNSVVEMFGQAIGGSRGDGFEKVMPMLLEATPDCGGIMALPFMDDEPGINVNRGGTAMLAGLNSDNATPGNVVKAALLATMFNLRLGCEILDGQGFPRTELVLSGGLTKTPELAQLLADVFANPVKLLESAEEGTAWGAALMAKYRSQVLRGADLPWSEFLGAHATESSKRYQPLASAVTTYEKVYQKYKKLVEIQPILDKAINN